ncbi:MAG: hypothetical protein GPJ51_01800 [Candidatus Heimdallarchaeota archaeon]|nr:hypothetical protein [Candidatus Heimdallarchaeota archaeon]
MSYNSKKEHSVALERERLTRLMEERAVIEEMMRNDDDHTALRNELSSADRRKILKPARSGQSDVKYTADGRSYFDNKRFSLDTTYLGPKYDVTEMLESEQLVLRVMKELEERKKLMSTPIAEVYKDIISGDEPPNKYFAIRKMGKFLEEEEFTAEEIAMLRTLMRRIVRKHEGSKEELLLSLYVEEKL